MDNKCPRFHKIISIISLVFHAIIILCVIIFPDNDNSVVKEYNECRNKTISNSPYSDLLAFKDRLNDEIEKNCGIVKNNIVIFYEYATVYLIIFFRSIMSITYLLTKQCQLLHLFFVVPLYLIFIIGLRLIKYEEKILNAKLIFLAIDSFINILSLTYLCSFDSDCGKAYDENMKCKNNCIDIYFEKRKEEKSKEIPQKIEALKNKNKLLKEANDKILKELTELNDEYENSVLSNVENKKIEVILWYVKKKYNKSYPPDIIYQILTIEMKEKFKININNSSKIKEIFLFYIKEKFIECLTCPLTADIFLNPVTTPEGQTFDKNYLLKELEKTGKNPLTRSPLNENHLVENKLVRDLCEILKFNLNNFEMKSFKEMKNLLINKNTKKFYSNPYVINVGINKGETTDEFVFKNPNYSNRVILNIIEQFKEILDDDFINSL